MMRIFYKLALCLVCLLTLANTSSKVNNPRPLPEVRQGKDHALLFAVSDYSGRSRYGNLPNVKVGAEALETELREMYDFDTKLVLNASKEEIYRTLREYTNRPFGPDDQLFLFFSGHGEFDEFEAKGYFLPRSGNRIDLTTLGNIITQIPCRHILLTIDACYSGTIDQRIVFQGDFKRRTDTNDNARQQTIALQLRNKSRLLLTSGGKVQTPNHGWFTLHEKHAFHPL